MAVPADWDFGEAAWALDPVIRVSAPSSIRLWGAGTQYIGWVALCKKPDSLCLPQGRIVTYLRIAANGFSVIPFRNQSANGSASPLNGYYLLGLVGNHRLYRIVAGAATQLDTWPAAWFTANTWHLIRLSWWLAYNYQNAKTFGMRLERYVAGEWVILRTTYDITNMWEYSGVNRVGIGSSHDGVGFSYFDDTEIWKPSE